MEPSPSPVNVAARLARMAEVMPEGVAVVEPRGYGLDGRRRYRHMTFVELDRDSDRIASGLASMGVTPGTRLALLVRPGIDFISLVFGLFKAGTVAILVDPGMGRRKMVRCLAEAQPEGFVAIPAAHVVRSLLRRRFPDARFLVTVGRRWFWGGATLAQFRRRPWQGPQLAPTGADDPAAIIFTTGSTGPAKGVLYRHGNFDRQVAEIRDFYDIRPGEIDLPCFPLFGLFNCAMGVTAVVPDMDPSRPARVSPKKILEAARDWKITQAFGSPAIWNRVGRYCEARGERIETLRRVLSAGAPVPAHVLRRMKACIHPEGDVHTPYGATEALPVASIAASQVLRETAARTDDGAGVCVGRRFPGIQWRVIRIVDGPIETLDQTEPMALGEIGELIVRGPVVTRGYLHRPEANALSKIAEGQGFWHRMGDSGYLDESGRFWFCGRVAHRVRTAQETLFTIPCEAIFNRHPAVARSALVGVESAISQQSGTRRPGTRRPVVVLEPVEGRMPRDERQREALLAEIRALGQSNPVTRSIDDFLFHPSLPVDVRHNVKISRETLAVWAAGELGVA